MPEVADTTQEEEDDDSYYGYNISLSYIAYPGPGSRLQLSLSIANSAVSTMLCFASWMGLILIVNLSLPVFAIANLRNISLHAVRVCSIGPVFTF